MLFGVTGQSMTLALLLLAGGFATAGTFVVMRYIMPPPMMFQPAKRLPALPARKLEHRIRVSRFEQQTQRPKLVNKLVSKTPGRIALPALPPITSRARDMRTAAAAVTPAGAHIGQLGLGGFSLGTAAASGLKGVSEISFFGQRITTRAFVVLMDNSPSMRTRGVVAAALTEMSNIVARFHPDTRFNVIAYRDGAGAFRPEMTYASVQDKQAFCKWIRWLQTTRAGENCGNQVGTVGTTPLLALKAALAMNPDTIIILRDDQPPYADRALSGAAARKDHARSICAAIAAHQRDPEHRVTINTLLFKPARIVNENQYKECVDLLRRCATMTGGHFREIGPDADGRLMGQ
jgi:hypothetical protein